MELGYYICVPEEAAGLSVVLMVRYICKFEKI